MTTVQTLTAAGVMGVLGGLAVKIIFDWLQKKKDADHEVRIKHLETELEKGSATFKAIEKDIVTIKLCNMALVTWLKAKGQDIDFDTDLFSN